MEWGGLHYLATIKALDTNIKLCPIIDG